MKKLVLAIVAALSAAVASAAESAPVFNATFTMGKETRFILVSPAGESSGWMKLGDEFAGYTLKDFDAATSTLVVTRGGLETRLSLADDAMVQEGAPAATGTRATLADAANMLEVMRFEEMMEKMFAQQKQQSVAMVRQMTSQMDAPGVDREELATFQEKVMNEMMSALNPAQLKQDMAQIYSELFTKEELAAQSAFYTTPAGRAMIDKTPAVQARLQQVMMPRIQAAMPKIMQMGKEFQMQQQAKAQAAAAGGAPAAPATPKG